MRGATVRHLLNPEQLHRIAGARYRQRHHGTRGRHGRAAAPGGLLFEAEEKREARGIAATRSMTVKALTAQHEQRITAKARAERDTTKARAGGRASATAQQDGRRNAVDFHSGTYPDRHPIHL